MDFIDDFIARYTREYDFYTGAAGTVARKLEGDLQEAGVRSIVSSRAKSISRLEAKCRQRDAIKPYSSVEDIYDDIVDLAGVRVALYFPGQRTLVDGRIEKLFHVVKKKTFPEEGAARRDDSRFDGYVAQHYHVRLKDDDLAASDSRYAAARVEIQVASVLMHAWAEVNHDLVYKPLEGNLSVDEYAILDHLNGLVMTGEGLLETLQRAGERRIAERSRKFANHFELAAHLLSQPLVNTHTPVTEVGLGRIDLLFDLLSELRLDTPAKLGPYLQALHGNFELRPLAEQVIDALLTEDESRYELYRSIRAPRYSEEHETSEVEAVGQFLSSWINLERLEREIFPSPSKGKRTLPTGRELERSDFLDEEMRGELNFLRRMRNQLVHGIETPSPADLRAAADRLDAIATHIRRSARPGPPGPP